MRTQAEFEQEAAQLLTRSLLLTRALHSRHPWFGVIRDDSYGFESDPFPLERQILPAQGAIVFTGYLTDPIASADLITVWCRGQIMFVTPLGGIPGPLRVHWELSLPGVGAVSE